MGLAQAGVITDSYNFNDNQLPAGWSLSFGNTPSRNAAIRNQRFDVGQVDTYAEISKSYVIPLGTTQLEISYTANLANVFWGMGNRAHLYDSTGSLLAATDLWKQGFGLNTMLVGVGAGNGTQFQAGYGAQYQYGSELALTPNYGTYFVDSIFRDGQIQQTVSKTDGSVSFTTGFVSTPSFLLSDVSKIGIHGATTTGASAWIDDLSIEATFTGVLPPPQTITLASDIAPAATTNSAQTFLSQQLNVGNQLAVYKNGQLIENVAPSSSISIIDSKQKTYVLIHGWNGPDSYATSHTQESLLNPDPKSSLKWVSDAAAAIAAKDLKANIIAWNWTAMSDSLSPDFLGKVPVPIPAPGNDIVNCEMLGANISGCNIVPTYQIPQQASVLANALRQLFPRQGTSTSIGEIQVMGHSLGAAVGAYAVNNLLRDSQALPITRLTLFDAPENNFAQAIVGTVNLYTVLPDIQNKAPKIMIENYIASGDSDGILGYGLPYYADVADTKLIGYAHAHILSNFPSTPMDWYTPTITATMGTAANRGINEDVASLTARAGEIWANQNPTDPYDLSLLSSTIKTAQYSLGLIYNMATTVGQAVTSTVSSAVNASKAFANKLADLGSSVLTVEQTAVELPFSLQTAGSTPAFIQQPWSAQGQAEVISGLGLRQTTHSPSYAFTTMHIPDWADAMVVDFLPEVWSEDDAYVILIDDQIFYALMGSEFKSDWMDTGFLDISQWAGKDVLFTLGFLSDEANHSIVTGDLSFYAKKLVAVNVPEPAAVWLFAIGLAAFVGVRRRTTRLARKN